MTEHELKPKQLQVIKFIAESCMRGKPPTLREIGDACGLSSLSSVDYQLTRLDKMGYIRKGTGKSRDIDVLRVPSEFAGTEIDPEYSHQSASPESQFELATLVPLVGQIAAGVPITAEQHVEDVMPLPRALVGEGAIFMLRVVGDSMVDAAICDGDYVVVKQQNTAENGEIVAAIIDDEATVKTFKKTGGQVWLLPQNPVYEPIPGNHATIVGKVIAVLRSV